MSDTTKPPPALKLQDLRFRYRSGDAAWTIDIPSFTIAAGEEVLPAGEQVLLTGGSGRGKSTLLFLIAGLMTPTSGRVLVAGQDIHAIDGAKRDQFRGRSIGMIFQTFNLLHGFTAAENVMAALMLGGTPQKQHRAEAIKLLESLELPHPDRRVEELSVGQQQRVAVARALACNPALVLADEPTASLDPENAARAIELIQTACRKRNAALLCVSHDPAMAERFDRRESLDAISARAAATAA